MPAWDEATAAAGVRSRLWRWHGDVENSLWTGVLLWRVASYFLAAVFTVTGGAGHGAYADMASKAPAHAAFAVRIPCVYAYAYHMFLPYHTSPSTPTCDP